MSKFKSNPLSDVDYRPEYMGCPPERYSNGNFHIYIYGPMFSHSKTKVILGESMVSDDIHDEIPECPMDAFDKDYCQGFTLDLPTNAFKTACELAAKGAVKTLIEMAELTSSEDYTLNEYIKPILKKHKLIR